ncbi:coiled-coil domain-containing protein 200 [Choloepus didactylus]|uniref:coiled-coil domain-containing protein 200 n=1 Tax=Choloepus didactylus TaxID=27675 RepID=UPI00189F68D4|nr:coiled-coil domain-containing protein 200 [Choloepus didactylus]
MGSAYHWEARRRQMALDQRRWLMAQQQKQQEQEPTKLQEEEQQPEKRSQPSQEQQVPQPPLPPSQQPPVSPQPLPPPRPQCAQDNLTQCTTKYMFKDTHRPDPQGGHQAGGQSNKFQEGLKTLPSTGPKNPCQSSPAKYTRFSSINYKQQW